MTELDAVNEMLRTIREAPVNSLEGTLFPEASEALITLRTISRDVQRSGWSFNKDKDVTLARDNDGKIAVTDDVIRVNVDSRDISQTVDPVLRGKQLYNRAQNTYVFSSDIRCTRVIRFLEWDQLPESAQRYISLRAARTFSSRIEGGGSSEKAATREELFAMRELVRDYNNEERPNMLNSPGIAPIAHRQPWSL